MLAVVVAALVGSAAFADESRPVAPSAARWIPTGLGTFVAARYPAGSLHVGAVADQETDRTYLRFDLPALPDEAQIDEVTVTIPVAPEAGTSSPESAVMLACAVPEGFDPKAAAPAKVNCDGAPTATLANGAFSVTVAARDSTIEVALVPRGGTWHVAFDDAKGDAPPMAVARYDVPEAQPSADEPTFVDLPPDDLPPDEPFAAPPTPTEPFGEEQAIAEAATPPDLAAPAAGPLTSTPASQGFRYAAVFTIPLVALVLIGTIGSGLTRPVQLRQDLA